MTDRKIIHEHIKGIESYLDKINHREIINVAKVIKTAIHQHKQIFIIGNGGSLATASHLAEDIMLSHEHKAKIFVLSSSPCITAISNDYGYPYVFSKQLENLMDTGDVLIAISCSGQSVNIIKAVNSANRIGYTIGLSGFDGGVLRQEASHSIHIQTEIGSYELTEDLHSIICHILTLIIKDAFGREA